MTLRSGSSAVLRLARWRRLWLCLAIAFSSLASWSCYAGSSVKVSEQDVMIPTYLAGEPEPSPMFFFGKASQGAEGRVYPYPLYDNLTQIKKDKQYRLVYLENEYVRIGILPEIGGRIFEGVDKSNGYDFFYRQHVIKPALIGLIGAWISGGVEWNIPHHHRATTFLPVQYRIEDGPDGAKTVWVGELELRHRMRWAVGYTLRPGKSYLEAQIRILNRTPVQNTMLCFANVAVHVNDQYQVIFPPSTQYVTHHHKREFTTWPIATTPYGGYDFSKGIDVSWMSNHVAANSLFAWNYEDDFFAGYDHGKNAGLMSVADHRIVPGKKLWTWGNGPRGRMWDHILTDNDGPYIELMVGGYSDNQPDYSWLQPMEGKSFSMFWYPFQQIGGVTKANLEAAVNVETNRPGVVRLGFCTTSKQGGCRVELRAGDRILLEKKADLDPARPFLQEVQLPAGTDVHQLRASLTSSTGELISYVPQAVEKQPMPPAVQSLPAPKEIKNVEELYLAGRRIEQFHHATLEPDPYWEEALRLDPGDTRVNTALGIAYVKRARYVDAERVLRKALERLTASHTTPKEGEPFYYLGLALVGQGKRAEAFDAFAKASWSSAWKSAACFQLAQLSSREGKLQVALNYCEQSIQGNLLGTPALNLKAALLRHLGRKAEARQVLENLAHRADPLDVRSMAERWLVNRGERLRKELSMTLARHPATATELAGEFWSQGLWQDGLEVFESTVFKGGAKQDASPLLAYFMADLEWGRGRPDLAQEWYQKAARCSMEYAFPFQAELIAVLKHAMELHPEDARAPYLLGNLLYDWQPEEAIQWWEKSSKLDPAFAMAHRNLAIAWSHRGKDGDMQLAIGAMERALASPKKYPSHFAELDELYEAGAVDPAKRLAQFQAGLDVSRRSDSSLSREIALRVWAGEYNEAIQLMKSRRFAVWEGASLSVADSWTDAQLLLGHDLLKSGKIQEGMECYRQAQTVPENLPSDQDIASRRRAEIALALGNVWEASGDTEKARQSWKEASQQDEGGKGFSERSIQLAFRAEAKRKLSLNAEADADYAALKKHAEAALAKAEGAGDFFASFGGRQSKTARLAMAHYGLALAARGLGDVSLAGQECDKALQIRPDLLGARTLKQSIEAIR